MKVVFSAVLLIILSNFGLAQKLSETWKFRMLNTYHKALDSQTERENLKNQLCLQDEACKTKTEEFGKFVTALQSEMEQAAKESGFPVGTKFNIVPATDTVTPIQPSEKKTEPKK